jgi:hypothetical protein
VFAKRAPVVDAQRGVVKLEISYGDATAVRADSFRKAMIKHLEHHGL